MNRTLLLAAMLLAGAAACSNSTGGGTVTKPPGALIVATRTSTALAPCASSAGAWFVKRTSGPGQELPLLFPKPGEPTDCSGNTKDLIRLKLDRASLLTMPNGTPIAVGDSVFISIVWAGGDSMLFSLEPTGLVFDPAKPAELKIDFGETEEAANPTILNQLAIWRQAAPTDDFTRLSTMKLDLEEDFEVNLNGFSRYALAY